MNKLDQEEGEILEAFLPGGVKRYEDAAETQKRHQECAEAMLRKDARINIGLPSNDLRGLQKKAFAAGIPYPTRIASILHRHVACRLPETVASERPGPEAGQTAAGSGWPRRSGEST